MSHQIQDLGNHNGPSMIPKVKGKLSNLYPNQAGLETLKGDSAPGAGQFGPDFYQFEQWQRPPSR